MGAGTLNWRVLRKKGGWLLPPSLTREQRSIVANLRKRVPRVPGVIWLLSSGTQSVGQVKAIGLTAEALEASATAANAHLAVNRSDRWLLTLPTFHVGGLGILVRATLSGSRVYRLGKWNPNGFVSALKRQRISLTSLVPTQVYDLVTLKLSPPASLRAVVVGGGALAPDLYERARKLGWPLLPSYGLTEGASQVATAPIESLAREGFPLMKLLPHVQMVTRDKRLWLKGPSLARWIARADAEGQFTLEDPLIEGWFATEDLGELFGDNLRVIGRRDDIVKILGELVPLPSLEQRLMLFFEKRGVPGELVLLAVPGGRAGYRLVVVTSSEASLSLWTKTLGDFNRTVAGPERVAQFCWVDRIPRGELGKVKKAELRDYIKL